MLIEVKPNLISKGIRNSFLDCPVALAIRDVVNDKILVADDEILVGFRVYRTPRSVARFIRKFDKQGRNAVKPFRFKLEI